MQEYSNTSKNVVHYMELAQKEANKIGVNDLSKVGIVRELIMASILNHKLVDGKHIHDAEDEYGNKMEYLSKKVENSSYAFDCMFSRPETEKQKSLSRITRNDKIYFADFDGIIINQIYLIEDVEIIKDFVNENLTKRDKNGTSKNNEHTVSIPHKLVKEKGVLIYDRN